MAKKTIYVNGGSFIFPYYGFSGSGAKEANKLKLRRGNRYTFRRLADTDKHPFYVTDSITGGRPSKYLSKRLSGDGSVANGIEGTEEFTIKINKNFRPNKLYYVCTEHPEGMFYNFDIVGKNNKKTNQPQKRLGDVFADQSYDVNGLQQMAEYVRSDFQGDFHSSSDIV